MKSIECNLPDINFKIKLKEENYEVVINKVNESIIPYKSDCQKCIEIEYVVDKNIFQKLYNLIKNNEGIFYDSFKNQQHKEVKIESEYYYLVNTEDYICNKVDELHYKIIVKENSDNSANWIVRIIRELYLREKEDKGYAFMHGTGIEIDNKGLLLLGTSGSGKTTLAVKMMELHNKKRFLSNDRVFVNKDMNMDYFPQAVTYAMGTVKNNKKLNKYFKDTRILEKKKKMVYEEAENDIDCNTPLTDVAQIFNDVYMTSRTKLNTIIYPRFDRDFSSVEVMNMNEKEKKELIEITNFTPNDTESLRKPWIRQRKVDEEELLEIRRNFINTIINNVHIKKIKYGAETKPEEILKCLEEE